MTIQIRVIQWEFGAAALMRNIDLSMWLRIVQWWLSHAGDIMTIRGRETALFFSYVNYCYDHMCDRGGAGRMQWNEITVLRSEKEALKMKFNHSIFKASFYNSMLRKDR